MCPKAHKVESSSWDRDFKPVELYLEGGLEMMEHSAMTLGKDFAQSLLINIIVLKCLSVCN